MKLEFIHRFEINSTVMSLSDDEQKLVEDLKSSVSKAIEAVDVLIDKNSVKKLDINDSILPIAIPDLIKRPINPFPYLIDKILPENAITTITGDTGSGKSLLMLHMMDCVSRGEKLFGTYETKKTNILIFDFEMDEDLLIGRCQAVCSDQTGEMYLMYNKSWKVENEKDKQYLTSTIKFLKIGLVVFDTLSKIHSQDENSNTDMTKVMDWLKKLTVDEKISVVLLHHHNKSIDATGLGRSRGASSIQDNSASYLQVSSRDMVGADEKPYKAMIISQEKKRRPESIGKIGVNVYYDKMKNKTLFEYISIIDGEKEKRIEAKPLIIETIEQNPGIDKSTLLDVLSQKDIGYRIVTDLLKAMDEGGEIIIEKDGRSFKHYLPAQKPVQLIPHKVDIERSDWNS